MKLLENVFEAHGGLKRWQELNKIVVKMVSSGKLFQLHDFPEDPTPREMTVYLHEQRASVSPFGAAGKKTNFSADRIAIETDHGEVLAERKGSPKELQSHMILNAWDPLDRANFNGYAMWTYLTTPFFMSLPTVSVTEISPWKEGETYWAGLRVTFPVNMASHCSTQEFYFGQDYLLRRHDYTIDVAGNSNFHAAQYVSEMTEVSGIYLPKKRRAYLRENNGKPNLDELMVAIDLSDIHFS